MTNAAQHDLADMADARFDPMACLEANARRFAGRAAVVDADVTLTFEELLHAVRGVQADLAAREVAPGDVVASMLPNRWEHVALEIAVPAMGAVILPLPVELGAREVSSAIMRAGAALVVFDEALRPDIPAACVGSPKLNAVVPVDDLQFREPPVMPTIVRPAPAGDRVVQIALTSGTTGRSKLASLSSELKQLTFEGFAGRLGLGPNDRMLPMSPITQGVGDMCLYALRAGATLVLSRTRRFDADALLELAEHSGATVLGGVPTMFGRLLHCARAGTTDFERLRVSISAGSPLPPALAEAWEALTGRPICSFYGAMDLGQLAVPRPDDPPSKRWTTVGRPHDVAEHVVLAPDGHALGPGEVGEICMRGPLVQQRYWGEAHGPFSEDGWAHFGDLGFVDDQGFLHVTGRIKDTIIRGGNNINPVEVEQVLREHPDVQDACVVGRPDADLGERAVAILVTSTGSPLGLRQLTDFLAGRGLTRYMWPEAVVVTTALPVGATGKVDRARLRRLALDAPMDVMRKDRPYGAQHGNPA